jgi:hypothetical protein
MYVLIPTQKQLVPRNGSNGGGTTWHKGEIGILYSCKGWLLLGLAGGSSVDKDDAKVI